MKILYSVYEEDIPPIPIVDIYISEMDEDRFRGPIPGILDTGADMTCFPTGTITRLLGNIAYEKNYVLMGINGQPLASSNYTVDLKFSQCLVKCLCVAETSVEDFAVIGRDVLNLYNINFNGPDNFAQMLSEMF
jgi:hypothetical protein